MDFGAAGSNPSIEPFFGMLAALVASVPVVAASIALSSDHVAATPVAITLKLRYEMQCGWPGPGPLVVTFPTAERLPGKIAPGVVQLNGRPAKANRSGHAVAVAVPPRGEVTCMVIGPGTATIEFKLAAGIGNPRTRGVYPISVQRGKLVLRTSFRIR